MSPLFTFLLLLAVKLGHDHLTLLGVFLDPGPDTVLLLLLELALGPLAAFRILLLEQAPPAGAGWTVYIMFLFNFNDDEQSKPCGALPTVLKNVATEKL